MIGVQICEKNFGRNFQKGPSPLWSANSISVFRPKLAKFDRFPQTLLYPKIEHEIRKILHIYELRIAYVEKLLVNF